MAFFVTQKTLERLEWPRVLACLKEHARTPGGRARCNFSDDSATLFEATEHGARERLEETSEARSILAAGKMPPLGDMVSPTTSLRRAVKGGALSARDLLELAATLSATRATRSFVENRGDAVPRLADLASLLAEHGDLEADIDFSIEPSGEVRDAASPALANARGDARRLAAEIQTRVSRYLVDPDTASHLSDSYYTIRNDRYVLPVRTDARGSVRGIVHDASNSGQTLFVEPEALVELNNQHKRAEIEIEQETRRVLRELSQRAAAVADEIEANMATLEVLDLAFARAGFSEEFDAVHPEVGSDGIIRLQQLRHPLLNPSEVVPNDIRLGEDFQALILSGANAGGKTVMLKAVALAVLSVRAGLHVLAEHQARVDLFDTVLADIGDEQDIGEHLSTFSAHMANLAEITRHSSPGALVVLDEVGVGTDPSEGAALAQSALEALADSGARVVATTHYNLLKEMAEVDQRFANASVEFDLDTLEPTYRLKMGLPGTSSATAVAARMGVPPNVIDRANEILQREDRQLDRVLSELAASRSALVAEQREIAQVRIETEAVRDEHREKLVRLQERRDKLFLAMREDLERSFRDAHEQIADVIADLQRKGTAQHAAHTREQLIQIAGRNREQQREAGLEPEPAEGLEPLDWTKAKAGDRVQIMGGGRGTLIALPDKRGRVAVRQASARVLVPMQRVCAAQGESKQPDPRVKVSVTRAPTASGLRPDELDAGHCNLHGMRVEEALDRLGEALDRALSSDRMSLAINHGVGTGALRRAVRDYLRHSPSIARYFSAPAGQGGEGVTIAEFV